MTDDVAPVTDKRLIERWLPIAAIGEESARERRSLQALPAVYYLHVWWARRPLVASRAAILASMLPANANHEQFLHALGIHGDPVASRRRIDAAKRSGKRFEGEAYSYPRAYSHNLTAGDRKFVRQELEKLGLRDCAVLDPTAGGGSVPLEAVRLGFAAFANDLNPVAALIEKATIEYPLRYGTSLLPAFRALANEFVTRREKSLRSVFPPEPEKDSISTNFLWARTIRCPYCDGRVPLSPNWRLTPDGTGVRLKPNLGSGPESSGRECEFLIVKAVSEQSLGTVSDGDSTCPFPDCARVISGDDIKQQAQSRQMGDQLYAVVVRRRIETRTKTGKRGRDKWQRDYRAPISSDDVDQVVRAILEAKMPEWNALDIVPSESIGDPSNYDRGHRMYGITRWRDMFSDRQTLCHATSVEIFRELLSERTKTFQLSGVDQAAFVYLSIAIDKMINWNARQSTWNVQLEGMRSVFDTHNFSMKWSFAEMVPLVSASGVDWTIEQCAKGLAELIELVGRGAQSRDLLSEPLETENSPPVTVSCKPGDTLDHIAKGSVDVIVIDPPYYDNVMYAELSDFFYVWLKRTAGHVVPELFTRQLTDKDNEAVANNAKFEGKTGARVMAGRDYQDRMARIFDECRRVLKSNGVMTLMFTHKATGAWDALTKGLMQAGFTSLHLGRSIPRPKAACTSRTSLRRTAPFSSFVVRASIQCRTVRATIGKISSPWLPALFMPR
jgi:putative DNA methylase